MRVQRASTRFLVAIPLTMLAASLNPACSAPNPSTTNDLDSQTQGSGTPESDTPGQPSDAPPDTEKAPPDFPANGKTAIFVDINGSDTTLNIDVDAKKATVKAHMDIEIHQPEGGGPLLDVVPETAQFVTVDGGQKLPLAVVTSPDGKSVMRMVDGTLPQGKHTLDFDEYALKEGKAKDGTAIEGIEFKKGGAEFLSNQDDTQPRGFTERYFPSGFEKDRYPFTLSVNILHAPAGQQPDVMARTATASRSPSPSTTTRLPGFCT